MIQHHKLNQLLLISKAHLKHFPVRDKECDRSTCADNKLD